MKTKKLLRKKIRIIVEKAHEIEKNDLACLVVLHSSALNTVGL